MGTHGDHLHKISDTLHPRREVDHRAGDAENSNMANGQLAAGLQRPPLSTLRRCPCPGCRRSTQAHSRHGRPAPARRGGLGDRRAPLCSTGERKYYLSNLPADTPLKQLAGAIKARWVCEQAHQQLKEELGLDHFEGRSWTGLHRHALMTMIAYAFLQSRRLKQAAAGKKNPRPAATAKPSSSPAGDPKRVLTAATNPMPTLP